MANYKVKVFSHGVFVYEKEIRADKVHISTGAVYLTKDGIDVFVGPVTNTIIEKI